MKKVMLIFVGLIYMTVVNAQSKQVALYLQQIAANKVLIKYIRKGYNIARTGLTTIGKIKDGEFSLHRDFFGALKKVNPKIKKSVAVVDIIALQMKIIKSYKSTYNFLRQSNQFTDNELDYIYSVFTRLLDDMATVLDELFVVITSNKYQMSDDERIKRIDELLIEMRSNFVFVQRFGNDAVLLSHYRLKEKENIDISRLLHGVIR